jgi:putative hydrolase of the HAD superfamily
LYIGDGGSHELEAADIMGMTALQARWYIKEVPELDIRKEEFEQLETPRAVLEKI